MEYLSWKQRQSIYHKTNEIEDYIYQDKIKFIVDRTEIRDEAIKYFYEDSDTLVYPSKSFAVAIIYAKMLEKYFPGTEFYQNLADPDLLYGNDSYFKPYLEDPEMYNYIIGALPRNYLDADTYGVRKTKEFFMEELMLTEVESFYDKDYNSEITIGT